MKSIRPPDIGKRFNKLLHRSLRILTLLTFIIFLSTITTNIGYNVALGLIYLSVVTSIVISLFISICVKSNIYVSTKRYMGRYIGE